MPIRLIPASNGEDNAPVVRLSEFNHCHDPATGQFCSDPISHETIARLHAIGEDDTIPESEHAQRQFEELQRREPGLIAAAQALIAKGQQAFPEFSEAMQGMAKSLGFSLHTNIESRDILERDTDWVVVGPVKGLKRTSVKAALDYGGDVNQVKDIPRGTIAVRDAQGMVRSLQQLADSAEIVNIKNRVSTPMASGYRDLNVIVRMPRSRMLAEIQVIAKPVLEAKMTLGHQLYQAMRGMKESSPRYRRLLQQQVDLYNSAWAKVAGAATISLSLAGLIPKLRGGV